MVTPTRPARSSASPRVNPTTPNFEAQYAVACPSVRSPSVGARVTTLPRLASSAGTAARTTAAVARRFTATMRSHVSPSVSSNGPGRSIPAAVTTASSRPWRSATARTASSASRVCARSTSTKSPPSTPCPTGAWRSRLTGVPPASRTAATTAAPRPEEPPVTSTTPGDSGTDPLDDRRGGPARDVGQDDGLAAPGLEQLRLGQIRDAVVAALDPEVGPELGEDGFRRVLAEDCHGVDAGERAQQRHAILLAHDGPVRPLEAPDRRVGVQADDEAVPERPRLLEDADVAGVDEVEAAAGGDDGAALRADARRERERLLTRRGRRGLGRGGVVRAGDPRRGGGTGAADTLGRERAVGERARGGGGGGGGGEGAARPAGVSTRGPRDRAGQRRAAAADDEGAVGSQ